MKAQDKKKNQFQFCNVMTLKMLILHFILLTPLISTKAQNYSKIILIDDYFNETQREKNRDDTKILSLIKNTQPSLYLNSEGIKKYGGIPVCLYSQAKYFINNYNLKNDNDFNSLEIIVIKIEDLQDLNSTIDASQFFNFLKLKYIYFVSTIDCSEKDIQNIVKNNNSRFTLLFSIQKPS